MTTVINLYAGPGTGKSTTAALIYAKLKLRNYNTELVREYVKDWVWEERKINTYDQVHFLGEQIRRESVLYGKVDYIITDSPVMLSLYYARRFAPLKMASGVEQIVGAYYDDTQMKGHQHHHIFLHRNKPYNPAGRFQTEEQAKEIDVHLKSMLPSLGIATVESGTTENEVEYLLRRIVPGYNYTINGERG